MRKWATAQHLLLPFNRPEYFSVPEALVSALAWNAYEAKPEARPAGVSASGLKSANIIGYMYQTTPRELASLSLRATRPQGEALRRLGALLKSEGGLSTEADEEILGEAVAASVLGIRIEKTGNQPASPMTPALALMQDLRGIMVKKGPPDFARIIEAMFAVGHRSAPDQSATRLWSDAADARVKSDPLLRAIDSAMMTAVLNNSYVRREKISPRRDERGEDLNPAGWAGLFPSTPFEWFSDSWRSITSPVWVESLPARVWVDWATTVLRLGIGLGFLWECAWYEKLGDVIQRDAVPETFAELVASVPMPLGWKSSRCSISVRDVGSSIKSRIARGERVRGFLRDAISASGSAVSTDALVFLRDLAGDPDSVEELRRRIKDGKETGRLIGETVKYGLQVRESSGPFTDYYGILKTHGRRWVVIDPGTEWIAVVASLACGLPGKATNVGRVLEDLSRMGMRPELGDLVELLERAGLARGSADADYAVIVESAF